MPRQIEDLVGIGQRYKLSKWTVRDYCRRPNDPLPHKKIGKHLRFDVEAVDRWFDRQPGRGGDALAGTEGGDLR